MGKHDEIAARFAGMATDGRYHPCYLEYFRLFNAQEYYAAHDVLEHIWLESDGQRYIFYKALIQYAGGYVHLQHHRREPAHRIHGRRLPPAARLFRRSAELLDELPAEYEGINVDIVRARAREVAAVLAASDYALNPWSPERAPLLAQPVR
jgi:predicted metal-dependent hydrolase